MKTVTFNRCPCNACSKYHVPGEQYDHSGRHEGRYVRESDYAALLERSRRLDSLCWKIIDHFDSKGYHCECDAFKSALAEGVEDGSTL